MRQGVFKIRNPVKSVGDDDITQIHLAKYATGGLAVVCQFGNDNDPTDTVRLSVALEDAITLTDDEFWLKHWSENAETVKDLKAVGLLISTGKVAAAGYETAKSYKLCMDKLRVPGIASPIWQFEFEEELRRRTGCTWADLCGDDDVLAGLQEDGDIPAEAVESYMEKYGLRDISTPFVATIPEPVVSYSMLRFNVPNWYKRPDFRVWLDRAAARPSHKSVSSVMTWHDPGKPGEFADIFVTHDSGEGSNSDMPEWAWTAICDYCKTAGITFCGIWLTNLEG